MYEIIIIVQSLKYSIHESAHPCLKRPHHASILWLEVDFL